MSFDVISDLCQSLSDQSMSTTMWDDLPDEIILLIIGKLPFLSLSSLYMVNKRTNRLVNEFKQSVTIIHSSDIEQLAKTCDINLLSDDDIDQNIAFKFKDKLVNMISSFPKRQVIGGSKIVNNLIIRLDTIQNYLWYDLAKIIPNIRSLFDNENVLGYRNRLHDDLLCEKDNFVKYVLEIDPLANPCCDQILKIAHPDENSFIFGDNNLTCKLDFCYQIESPLSPHHQEPILSRRVDLHVDNSILDIIKYELPNMMHIEIDNNDILEDLNLELFKSKMSRFCPNLNSMEINYAVNVEAAMRFVDFDNNHILSFEFFTNQSISDSNLRLILSAMLKKNRFLENVEINSFKDHLSHPFKMVITKNKLALFPYDEYVTLETDQIYVQIRNGDNLKLEDLLRLSFPEIPARIFVTQDDDQIIIAAREWIQDMINSVIESHSFVNF